MPVSYLAHQVPLAPLKLYRPDRFDATALVVGSLVPDLLYSYTSADVDTNHIRIFGTHGFVLGLLATLLVRYLLAPVVAAHLPDFGAFRIRSLSVLDHRRLAPLVTLTSLAIGLCSHAALDWLTHDDRRGPRTLGYDDVGVSILGWHGSLAEALQIGGSLGGIAAAAVILRRLGIDRTIEGWYGTEQVERARSWEPPAWSRVGLVATIVAGAAVGLAFRNPIDPFISFQRIAVGAFTGAVVWSAIRWPARRAALTARDARNSNPPPSQPLPPPTAPAQIPAAT